MTVRHPKSRVSSDRLRGQWHYRSPPHDQENSAYRVSMWRRLGIWSQTVFSPPAWYFHWNCITHGDPKPLNTHDLDDWILENVVCPIDHADLERDGNWLVSTTNSKRRYPIAYGVPVMLSEELDSTAWWAIESLKRAKAIADGNEDPDFYDSPDHEIHPHVRGILHSTGGHLYKSIKQHIQEYPIPRIRIDRDDEDALLLDCGCHWGRLTFFCSEKGNQQNRNCPVADRRNCCATD